MNISKALKNSYNLLSGISKTYKLDTEVLLAHVLKKKNRLDLFLNTKEELNKEERKKFIDNGNQRISKKTCNQKNKSKKFLEF